MILNDKDFYSAFFNSFEEGICIVDNQGTILVNNSALEEIFGYNKDELIHQNFNLLIPGKYKAINKKQLYNFFISPSENRLEERFVFKRMTKNGDLNDIEIRLKSFAYQGTNYTKVTLTDISIIKYEENKIREQNYRLQLEVKRHTAELRDNVYQLKKTNKKLNEEIKKKVTAENRAVKAFHKELELNHLQTKFLSMVSHEFKTPLSGMLTSIILIDKYTAEQDNPNIRNHIHTIKNLIFQLNAVLNDFLNLEKSESKNVQYELSSFNICELLDQVIQNTETILKPGQHVVIKKPETDIEVVHDRSVIDIILRNIIYNAIKYSQENKGIKVRIKLNKDVFISIQDKGIGIPDSDQPHIFNRFFRAKNALHFQGTGIGLNIAKHHIEMLGGKIGFKSKENKGTTFILKLPVKAKLNKIDNGNS